MSFCSRVAAIASLLRSAVRKDSADSPRGGMFSFGVGNGLEGSGLDPLGRAGRFVLRSARYEAEARCEYRDFQGGLRGAMLHVACD